MKRFALSRDLIRRLNLIAAFSFCLSSSLFALKKLNYPLTGIDDANIYFVYAKNLANRHGFVYNVGGERVEGFTSLLWTLIAALAFKFSSHPELTLLLVNIILISFGIAAALHYLHEEVARDGNSTGILWSVLYLVLIFVSPRYLVWNTVTLMENALWSTLLLLTTLFVIREHVPARETNLGFIPLSALLLLTRPESILWVAVFTTVLLLRLASQSDLKHAVESLVPSIIGIVVTFVALTAFRLSYFGYPFPNTYYAKVSPVLTYNIEQGAIYLAKYFLSDVIVTLSMIAIFVAALQTLLIFFQKRIPDEGSLYLPLIAAAGVLVPVLVGGDHFGSFRMYQNVYPIEVLALLSFVHQLCYKRRQSAQRVPGIPRCFNVVILFILVLGLVQNQLSIWNSISSEIGVEFKVADYGRKSGAFIQQLFAPLAQLPSMGVVTSGGIKYSYSGNIIDLLGLNNTLMAHNHGSRVGQKDHAAFDIPTFHRLKPDIVCPLTVDETQWQYSERDLKESWENTIGLKGLYDDAQFQALYTYAKVDSKSAGKYGLVGWFKNDLLKRLQAGNDFHVEEYNYRP